MSRTEVSGEIIGAFLEGRDPQKYIVAIEAPYYQNIVSLIINDPVKGKSIQKAFYKPFLWLKHDVASIMYEGNRTAIGAATKKFKVKITELKTSDENGDTPSRMANGYKYIAKCDGSYTDLLSFFKEGGIDIYSEEHRKYFMAISPTEQFLIQSGKRLFRGFEDYDELHRLQFDLETSGLFHSVNSIFQIGVKDNRGYQKVIEVKIPDLIQEAIDNPTDTSPEYMLRLQSLAGKELRGSERNAIKEFFNIIDELRPDIIAGYNSEAFDWDFIYGRCEVLGIKVSDIAKTLDGSKIYRRDSQLKLGGNVEHYQQTHMWGTNIIDVMHSVRRAQAINSDIKKAGLKYITKFSKIAKPNRVYVEGNMIHKTWADKSGVYYLNDVNGEWFKYNEENSEQKSIVNGNEFSDFKLSSGDEIVRRYLIDDLWETEQIDARFNQATFLLGKIIPTSYMKSSTMGTAGIWKLIMMAWSYENNLGVPELQPQQTFTGGLSRLLEVGFAEDVAKLDYAALYPNIEITHDIFPSHDISGVMKGFLLYMAETRDIYKKMKGDHEKVAESLRKDLEANQDTYSVEKVNEIKLKIQEELGLADKFDKKQLPIKILANSFFGSFGAPHLFPWGDLDSAEETTCRGRQYLRLMVKVFHEKHGFRPLVGDSVTFDTPVYLKDEYGFMDIKPISELFNDKSEFLDNDKLRDFEEKKYSVLTRNGWKRIKYVYRHETDKNIHRITTKDSLLNVTEDHSLFQDGVEVKPSSLKRGDKIDINTVTNNLENGENIRQDTSLSSDMAWLYGFFLGDGSATTSSRKQYYKSKKTGNVNINKGTRGDWKISNTRIEYLLRLQEILTNSFGVESRIKNHLKSSGVYNLVVTNTEFAKIFTNNFYTNYREKRVPKIILNSNLECMTSFMNGVCASDGYGDTLDTCSDIGMKSQIAMSGIAMLLNTLRIEYKIKVRSDKENFISLSLKNNNRGNSKFTDKTLKKSNEVWKNETILNRDVNKFVYDISTEDGTFICGIGGVIAHNTDGFNFAMPSDVNNFEYYPVGTHRMTSKNSGKRLIGLEAVVAKFNEDYMIGRMGLDVDAICDTTINFSRKNYANRIGGKNKLVGNTIKSKKMPIYIEEFLDTGIDLLLSNKGYEFIEFYHKTVDTIVNYEVPLVKIASKSSIRKTVSAYKAGLNKKNKAGNPMPRQAHMELCLNNNLDPSLGETIYYVNTGTTKSQGDIKTIKKAGGGVEVEMMCKIIPTEQIESNPNLTTDEYNAPKYLAAFNKRINPLLVCFQPEIRNKILIDFKKSKLTKLMELPERFFLTRKECELSSGIAFKDGDQDDYHEDLMKFEDKELAFWVRVNKVPNNIEEDEWEIIKTDYIERSRIERIEGVKRQKEMIDDLIRRLEVEQLELIRLSGIIPNSILKFLEIDSINDETCLVSILYSGSVIFEIQDLFKYEDEAIAREEWYLENSHETLTYDDWLDTQDEDESTLEGPEMVEFESLESIEQPSVDFDDDEWSDF